MKTIGLLGGMSWESTIPYYRLINEGIKQRLGGEFSHVFQCGELIGQYFRLIRDQCIHTEIFVRKNNDGRSGFLVPEFDF